MTNLVAGGLLAQVVHTGSAGTRLRASSLTTQIVMMVPATRVRLAKLMAQVIETGATGARVRVDGLHTQVIFGGGVVGSTMRVADLLTQVVFTIGLPASAIQRAWGFELDEHTCYCIDLGAYGTIIFDKNTGQWYHFETDGYEGEWNMKNGFQWLDGKKIIAGDIATGDTYYMDTASFYDDGWRPIVFEMTGAVFSGSDGFTSMYAVRLIGGAGKPTDSASPEVELQYSDDEGQTWTSAGVIALDLTGNQRIAWTSLGAYAAPGRLLKFLGTGGLKYIGYVVADIDG